MTMPKLSRRFLLAEKKVKCQFCDKTYKGYGRLSRHIAGMHCTQYVSNGLVEPNVICWCGEVFQWSMKPVASQFAKHLIDVEYHKKTSLKQHAIIGALSR